MDNIRDIRNQFATELKHENFVIDKTGLKTIEIIGASFHADESSIFGKLNEDYIHRELEWYKLMSSNINDIYDNREPPSAWKYAANEYGEINSNYGLLIFSKKYGSQYDNVLNELLCNIDSRRASMIYQRPSIWLDYNDNNKNDFICTNAHTYYIRNNKMHVVVQMRSNDVWAGYRNDYAWSKYILNKLIIDYNIKNNDSVEMGTILWQVQNLHCYEKNFYLIDLYNKGLQLINKKEYINTYPNSKFI